MSFHVIFNAFSAAVDPEARKGGNSATPELHCKISGESGQVRAVWCNSSSRLPPGQRPALTEIGDRCWLLGRVRLDGRDDVKAALRPDIRTNSAPPSDGLLCLQAYRQWGDGFLDRLRGDFCFVIWDEERKALISARDQLGVRPLFYSHIGNEWHVSDSLDSLASSPGIEQTLDDYWIADFLGIDFCLDFDRTVYKHVHRLPPAHMLLISRDGASVRRYWTLEVAEPLHYRKSVQYIEHFREALGLAIADRLPPARVGISMSGGLDSPIMAAQAVSVTGDPSRVVAHTQHFEWLIPDEEKYFSTLVADRLGIEIVHQAVDENCYDHDWQTSGIQTPEPTLSIISAVPGQRVAERMSTLSDVWFFGEGPDNALMFEWRPYLRWLARRRDWAGLGRGAAGYVRGKQLREWRTTLVHAFIRKAAGPDAGDAEPAWLNSAFAAEVNFSDRFLECRRQLRSGPPWHPAAIGSFKINLWQRTFDSLDPVLSKSPLDWRHPYLDLRVLTFLLSVPPIPWGRRKRLLREAMRGILPDEVLSRDKTPLMAEPLPAAMRGHPLPPLPRSSPVWRYIDATAMPDGYLSKSEAYQLLKVHVLDTWLRDRRAKIKPS